MGRVQRADTAPERVVRQLLGELGIRLGRVRQRLPGRPDFVSIKGHWAIFVHGCFWHAHPGCRYAMLPRNNRVLWREKLDANRERDRLAELALRRLGFQVLVLWECDLRRDAARTLPALRQLVAPLGGRARNASLKSRKPICTSKVR
jgi:DNA mismatch endonuclease (patch repair protein)